MAFVHQPLQLSTFARLSIAKESQRKTRRWEVFLKRCCPVTLLKNLLFIIKIAEFGRDVDYRKLDLKRVAEMLIRTCLKEPHKMFYFEEKEFGFYDPFNTVNLLKELLPLAHLPIQTFLRGNQKIMLNHYEVLKLIIQLNNRICVINNLLFVSVLYGRLDVAKLCVKYGADDFDTAGRVAGLTDPVGYIYDYVADDAEMSDICIERYSEKESYRRYHDIMQQSRHVDPYTRHLADWWLRSQVENGNPFYDRTPLVGNLDRPLTTWSFENILKCLNYVHHFEIEYLRDRYVTNPSKMFSHSDHDQYIRNNCVLPVKK